jgi:hypothetical protein
MRVSQAPTRAGAAPPAGDPLPPPPRFKLPEGGGGYAPRPRDAAALLALIEVLPSRPELHDQYTNLEEMLEEFTMVASHPPPRDLVAGYVAELRDPRCVTRPGRRGPAAEDIYRRRRR